MKDYGSLGDVQVSQMFIGNIQGSIGESSVIALLIGEAILLAFNVIDF